MVAKQKMNIAMEADREFCPPMYRECPKSNRHNRRKDKGSTEPPLSQTNCHPEARFSPKDLVVEVDLGVAAWAVEEMTASKFHVCGW
jgi:hypothetical protein